MRIKIYELKNRQYYDLTNKTVYWEDTMTPVANDIALDELHSASNDVQCNTLIAHFHALVSTEFVYAFHKDKIE